MKSLDKYAKVGALSLHLQKYQQNPRYKLQQQSEDGSEVPSEQINMPPIRYVQRQSPKTNRRKSQSKEKSSGMPSAQRTGLESLELEDEQLILEKCLNLTGKIEMLKKQKYELAVQQYQQQERKKIDYLLQKQKKLISHKYEEKKKELKAIHERSSFNISKSLEENKKFQLAFENILEDLQEKKKKLILEHTSAIFKVNQSKEKLVNEWKRASNEEIHRCLKDL